MTNELDIVKELTETTERSKSNSHRIDKTETDIERLKNDNKAFYQINANIEKMCLSMDYTNTKLDETNVKLDKNIQETQSIKDEMVQIKTQDDVNFAKSIKKSAGKIIVEIFKYLAIGGLGYLLATLVK